MGFFGRLFMNDYQRRLVDPSQYRSTVEPEQLIADIKSGKTGARDPESVEAMVDAAQHELTTRGRITLAGVLEQRDAMDQALRGDHPACLHEFGVLAKLGATMLAETLVKRLNQVSEGIKPGAADALGGAFGAKAE